MGTIFYPYDAQGFATGKAVQAATKPKGTSEWEPPVCKKGRRAWFDGYGWRTVTDVTALDLETAREQLSEQLSGVMFVYEGNLEYSAAERSTFDFQYAEALEVKAGGDPGVYMSALIDVHGVTAEELADKIIANREAFNAAHAAFNAKVQSLRLQIKNAESIEELPSVVELLVLDSAK